MTTVSLPEEISAPFADAHKKFPVIISKPYENDVQHLCRRKFQALQDIELGDGTDATGLILSKVDHKAANENQVFDCSDRALEAYDSSIQYDNNNAVRLLQENNCPRKLNRQAAIQTTERVGKKFVFSRVEETWVVRLKNETTLFKHVTLRDILDHLGATTTGGEAIDVIGLQQGLLSWWVEYTRVPEFITRYEDAQQKARRSGLLISDAWLVAVVSCSLLADKIFPDERPKFEGLPRRDRTWEKWKSHFQDAQEELKRNIWHFNPSTDSFCSSNAAANIHGISHNGDTVQPAASRSHTQVTPPGAILSDEFIDYFSRLMNIMAYAATNGKAVLEQIFANMTTLYTDIKALLQKLNPQSGSNNSGRNTNTNSTNHTPDGDNMQKLKNCNATLQHAIMKGWTQGGFCSSHGHSVTAGHDNRNYPDWKPGHVETTTRENPAGPGQYSNKGWDDFWN